MTFNFSSVKPDPSRSTKWGNCAAIMGQEPREGTLPMWLAQMDFPPAPVLQEAIIKLSETGEYGYFTGLDTFQNAVCWWYKTRFGWSPKPEHVIATHGIGNAIGLTLQAMTEPGDGIVIFTPVYNEFMAKVQRNGRTVVESPLLIDEEGLFRLDLDALDGRMTGSEKIMLISSPHNPAGRVWNVAELRAMATFCEKHDLLLVSDEIHMDLAFPGQTQVPTALAAPDALPRLIVLSAASKTFDIAGLRTGYAIIPDETLRTRFASLHRALDIQPNRVGLEMTIAAYSPQGAAWVDALQKVLAENAKVLSDGLNDLPGITVMPMQGTFLAWIDFAKTGLTSKEIMDRVQNDARIAVSPGHIFGARDETCVRLNIGTPRSHIEEAVSRLRSAFANL
ncbi:cystathione beta-lyase [Cognatiyoonia koreensis]|uniref:cysteine-S-conjugate beta-lyase n=1 Tax=Cognatiyoonia koreensis TaxID=364200 RepID=A0A1I0RC42_9RHOB|nr:aminotransferase class I/II-fold pyridoxal phosphate-dependent enzyme [Cognatiyoonia koreensis]SEW38403.1 cystathione beta-lyase [Cognatiyoonia koreensis]